MKAKRIHITGNAGSGKSTLAQKLASQSGLPLYGLDKVVWQAGWKKTPHERRLAAEQQLIDKPEWIIEGVSSRVRNAADLVIFLDRTRAACTFRCLRRNLPYLFKSRPDLPPDCPELLILPKLIQIIWRFPSLVAESIHSEAKMPDNLKRFVVLKSDFEADNFLKHYQSPSTKWQALFFSETPREISNLHQRS